MPPSSKTLRTCSKGHQYYKSSSCPVCPVCEAERVPESEFMSRLSAPARRALENAGITTLAKFSKMSEKELLALHGMGPGSMPKLKEALAANGLGFSN